jgi:hypothetical protein
MMSTNSIFDAVLKVVRVSRLGQGLVLVAAVGCAFSIAAFGQSPTATLSGTVVDERGAMVAGAMVRIVDSARAFERHAATDGGGSFTFVQLQPSVYVVSVELANFAVTKVNGVALNIGDRRSLQIVLRAGAVSAAVTVENEASLVDENPAVSTVVDRRFVENIPLNGRSFQSLITLTPGVVLTKTNFAEQGQFSVNGQRADANYFTVDGVSANFAAGRGQSAAGAIPATTALGGFNNLVSIDALEEFRIQTSTYAPEFGRQPGGQVQLVTRSGTNRYQGSLFEYFRNDAFDANDFFANRNGLNRPPLRQNLFGGTFGGPLPLPNFGEGGPVFTSGKDRAFFFFSYEGLRLRQPQTRVTSVPSVASRSLVPAAIHPLINAFPIPNGAALAGNLAQFAATYSDPSSFDSTGIRIDHAVNGKVTIFGRFNYTPSEIERRGVGGVGNALSHVTATRLKTKTLTLGSNQIFSDRVSNELRVNFSRDRIFSRDRLENFGGAVVPTAAQLYSPLSTVEGATVQYNFAAGGVRYSVGVQEDRLQRQLNLVDNFSVVAGSHALKFGVDYRRLAPRNNPAPVRLVANFANVANAINGRVSSFSVSGNDELELLVNNFSIYAQDTWRVDRRLTLTYGLRYEINPAVRGANGRELYTVRGLDNPATLALAPAGTPLYKTTYDNFAPRVGAAFRLFETAGRETVLRGGFGVFYDLGAGVTADASFPYSRLRFGSASNFPLTPAQTAPTPFSLTPPFTALLRVADPNLKLPRVYQFNVGVEQSLGANQTLTATYLGALGRRLLRQEDLQNPNANFATTVFVTRNLAESDYHALQLQFQRRLSRGLQALVSYSFAKSLDNASSDSATLPRADRLDPRLDRAPSDFDVRHSFSAAVTYNIPAPFESGAGRAILGGFSLDAIYTARSATPVDVSFFRNLGFGFIPLRPDLVSGAQLYLDEANAPGGRRFNPAAFLRQTANRQGTLGRNALRGFPVSQLDLALRRQLKLTERVNLQLRAEAFNVLNRPNFSNPVGDLDSAFFGQSTSMYGRGLSDAATGGSGGGFNSLYQTGGPRSLQFAARLQFLRRNGRKCV